MPTSPLPAFSAPPVTEVVVSVQFDTLPKLAIPQLGLLWQRFRPQYPRTEQHPPLAPIVERLGVRGVMNQVRFEFLDGGPGVRLWFLNEQGDQLVQVQNDRFIRNWRRVPQAPTQEYPRFMGHVLPRFLEDYALFCGFLKDEDLGEPTVNQIEVSYINSIEANDIWRSHADLARLFRGWSGADLTEHPVEVVNLQVGYQLADSDARFLGRLHVVLQSGFRVPNDESGEEKPVFALTLTARGRPIGDGNVGILAFIELAHNEIVTSFDKMTTEEAHRLWRKKPAS